MKLLRLASLVAEDLFKSLHQEKVFLSALLTQIRAFLAALLMSLIGLDLSDYCIFDCGLVLYQGLSSLYSDIVSLWVHMEIKSD